MSDSTPPDPATAPGAGEDRAEPAHTETAPAETAMPAFANPWDPFQQANVAPGPDQQPELAANGSTPGAPAAEDTTQRTELGVAAGEQWTQPSYSPPTAYPLDPPGSGVPPLPSYPNAAPSSYLGDPYPAAEPPEQPATPNGATTQFDRPAQHGGPPQFTGRPHAEPYLATAPPPPYRGPAHSTHSPPPAQVPRPDQVPRPEALLAPNRPDTGQAPADWGWRGTLRRISGGLVKPKPTAAELADRKARVDIQRGFSKPMTVVVIQPKGGAGKTPTTIGVASALGVHRGGYVLGWDDNETRGTLAVRVRNLYGQSTTAWDLLGALPRFERADARVGDLSHFVRSQGEAQFDALASDDNPANMAQIGEQEFSRLHEVLQRFYRVIVIDTGNNVRSPNWQAAVNAADLVVVVSTYQRDVGYSGSWVLDHLGQTGRGVLANGAVTVLTAADPKPDPTVRRELVSHFGTRTRSVVEIPYDPHIAVGGPMEWSLMRAETRRAWTEAGAAVIDALAAAEGSIP